MKISQFGMLASSLLASQVVDARPSPAASAASPAASSSTYLKYASTAAQTMITDFFGSSGFGGLDWNSAVTLSALISLQSQAPNTTNPSILEVIETMHNNPVTTGWLDGYYDDQGWWTLAWMSAYDLTGESKYLATAESIFNNTVGGWNPKCGGLWWDKTKDQMNSIANVLFLASAAGLAKRVPSNEQFYLSWAEKEWLWWSHSGLLNTSPLAGIVLGQYNYNTCMADADKLGTGGFTYTQGVAINGLLRYAKVAPAAYKSALIGNATAIANQSLHFDRYVNSNGILTEPVGGFTSDTAEFKGIFVRGLASLQTQYPSSQYVDFATTNANSIWNNAKLSNGTFSPFWDSTEDAYARKTQVAAMSSALGGLVGAAMIIDSAN